MGIIKTISLVVVLIKELILSDAASISSNGALEKKVALPDSLINMAWEKAAPEK